MGTTRKLTAEEAKKFVDGVIVARGRFWLESVESPDDVELKPIKTRDNRVVLPSVTFRYDYGHLNYKETSNDTNG